MSQRIITLSFYLLFFLTPLIFTPLNYELFEYNKMMFVYLIVVILTGAWLIKMVNHRSLILTPTPLDIPILLFFLSQLLSTLLSIDRHTSIWGYYSRSNGGLLSVVSYIIIYYCFVSNFSGQAKQILKFLQAALISGAIISVWAIFEHFGHSLSCALLSLGSKTGIIFNDSCWLQDVQARVFASLGQPNWLAAYLGMLIFPTLYFLLQAKTRFQTLTYYLLSIIYYLAFTFTYSRGGTLGLLSGMGVFMGFYLWLLKKEGKLFHFVRSTIILLIGTFLVINLIFGSALTRFKLQAQAPPLPKVASPQVVTQLESGGTESGQIRLIVWKGALEIFKHYPLFGSGVETFAYSYYLFRPLEHNFVSEWDFLYNKAHNEYLNYLATTGAVGFLSYLFLIAIFLIWSVKRTANYQSRIQDKNFNFSFLLLYLSLLASYVSYLVQNIVQFSVVIIALFFYIFPAIAFSLEEPIFWPFSKLNLPPSLTSTLSSVINQTFLKRPSYIKALKIILSLAVIYLSWSLFKLWWADFHFAQGSHYLTEGNPGRAYNNLIDSVVINQDEPLYRSYLGLAAGSAALALSDQDATTSAQLKQTAILETAKALEISPANLSLWKNAELTFLELSSLDSSFAKKAIQASDQVIVLSPNNPDGYFNKAKILDQFKKPEEALQTAKRAVELKPNYREGLLELGDLYLELNQKDQAKTQYQQVLRLIPSDQEVLDKIKNL